MKKIFYFTFFLLISFTNTYSQIDSVSIIHGLHIKAIGGHENLDKIQSVKLTLKANSKNKIELNNVVYRVRPNFIRTEITHHYDKITITCEYLDSMLIWDETLGDKPVHTWQATEKVTNRKQIHKKPLDKVHFYNSFVEYKQHNYLVKYMGIVLSQGQKCFKLIVEHNKNTKSYYYINTTTNLLDSSSMESNLSEITTQVVYEDYRKIDGILFPFRTSNLIGGLKMTKEYEKIETNIPIDPRLFECVPLTQKIEDIKD